MEDKIIERPKQSLNFIEQLQNQIQLCREAMSDPKIWLSPKVEALECLLWHKLMNDERYCQKKQEIYAWYKEQTKDLKKGQIPDSDIIIGHKRVRAKKLFKEIIIFIGEKKLMPMGDEDYD